MGVSINIHERMVIYGIIIPALIVLRTLLQKLMIDRKTKVCQLFAEKFVDITPVRALFSIYGVTLCASASTDLSDVDVIRTNLIDSFLAYTWSNQSETEQSKTSLSFQTNLSIHLSF